jgi:hypothetical protein
MSPDLQRQTKTEQSTADRRQQIRGVGGDGRLGEGGGERGGRKGEEGSK